MRVIVDTNILVSGIFFRPSNPGKIVDLWWEHKFDLVTSEPIYSEVQDTFKKVAKKIGAEPSLIVKLDESLREYADVVSVTSEANICRDPKDNLILDTAHQGKADFIVSGDKDLLVLSKYKGTPILTPKEFLKKF